MKERILLFILIILTIPNVLALSISLSSPVSEGNNVTLKCTVTDSISEGISKLELWHDVTGIFSLNQTNTTEVSSGVEYSFDKLISLNDGTYNWNCNAFNLSNSEFTASSNSTFTISTDNPPSISSIGNIAIDEDAPFSIILTDNISDDKTSKTDLSFTFTNSNPSIMEILIDNATNNLSFFPILNQNGQSTINIIVWDSSLNQASNEFILTINSINDPPVNKTNSLGDESWFKNKNIQVDLTEYFTDPDEDILTYSASEPEYINITIDNSTGIATLTPKTDFVGSATAYFIAYDSNSSFTSNTINLTVKDTTTLNNAPNIDSYTPLSLNLDIIVDTQQAFSITKSDPENDNLTVKWFLDGQLVSQEDNYTMNSNLIRTHKLEVVVSDGALTDSIEWLINVKESLEQNETFNPTLTKQSLCGNNNVDAGENCGNCPNDVVCEENEMCINNKCTLEKKSSNTIVIIIVLVIVLLLGAVTAFYLYKKKQQELGFEVRVRETPKKELAPPVDLEDFYKEPNVKPQVVLKKPKNYKRVNIAILRTYIGESLQRGHSKEKIKSNLLKTGWKEQDINDALKEFR